MSRWIGQGWSHEPKTPAQQYEELRRRLAPLVRDARRRREQKALADYHAFWAGIGAENARRTDSPGSSRRESNDPIQYATLYPPDQRSDPNALDYDTIAWLVPPKAVSTAQ